MKPSLFVTVFFMLMNFRSHAQDSIAVKQFIDANKPYEQEFINALKRNDIGKCLTLFSERAISSFGRDFLTSELATISADYRELPEPEVEYSIGFPMDGIGTFGHDVEGSIELECSYFFHNKGNTPNSFRIYYTNTPPQGVIQTFTTKSSIDRELKK